MGHELQALSARHHSMVGDAIAGMTRKDIAEKYGMTPEGVGGIMKSPIFQDEVARRREKVHGAQEEQIAISTQDIRSKLNQASERAADTMIGLMDAPTPEMRFKSSQYVLDRVLGKEAPAGPATGMITIQADQLQILLVAMKESTGKELDSDH